MVVLSKIKEGEEMQREEYFTYFEDCISNLTPRLGKKGRLSTASKVGVFHGLALCLRALWGH